MMTNRRTPRLSDLIRQPAPSPPPPAEVFEEASGRALRIELSPAEAEARIDYGLLERWTADLYDSARRGSLEGTDVFETMQVLLDRPHLLEALFSETFRTRTGSDPLAAKALRLGIYALRLGRACGYSGRSLVEVGAAGLFAKLGFTRIPADLPAKPAALSRRELAAMREHPKFARELLAALGPAFSRVAQIVYQASERLDGSGYPEGLSGERILPQALLIGLVDVYEALVQPRPYRERLVPFRAVKEILERERSRFPRSLLRDFIASFSVFPPFSYVRLNSRAIARVEETEPGFPLRPRVTIVIGPDGRPPARPQTLRLRDSPLLYITEPLGEEELPRWAAAAESSRGSSDDS
jgi:HD-GYP domain-containing protein (c-di-GMP phosphodiesterase class II)